MAVTDEAIPTFVELHAADGQPLQGLLHGPPDPAAATVAVLHVHGKGGNAYTGPARTLPRHIMSGRALHLGLNMRCHDLAYTPVRRPDGAAKRVAGGMYERADEAVTDILAGLDWLTAHTGLPVIVAAHSAGSYFLSRLPPETPFAGRVLLSPLTTVAFALSMWFQDAEAREYAREQAQELVSSGCGHHLIPLPTWYWAISAEVLLERMAEPRDWWVTGMNASTAPVLMLWGGAESARRPEWTGAFDALTVPVRRSVEIAGAEHDYHGREAQVGAAVTTFLDEVLTG